MNDSFIDRIGGMNVLLIGGAVILSVIFLVVIVGSQGGRLTQLETSVVEIAESVGADKDKFIEDFKSSESNAQIDEDIKKYDEISKGEGMVTPSVFVNGVREDSLSFDAFKASLEKKVGKDPVEIIVFEDFQCPACSAFFPITYQIKNEFKDKVNIQRLNLPLETIHSKARLYARGAEAAKKQGLFFEFAKTVYLKENPNDYSVLDKLDKSVFKE